MTVHNNGSTPNIAHTNIPTGLGNSIVLTSSPTYMYIQAHIGHNQPQLAVHSMGRLLTMGDTPCVSHQMPPMMPPTVATGMSTGALSLQLSLCRAGR